MRVSKENNKKDVITPKIIVVPILKKVEDTIVGIINNIINGFKIPPVRYKRALSWNKSYKRNNEAYVSFNWFTFILNWRKKLVNSPITIII